MPRSSELSDFEKGIIIGYHKCGRSLRDISSDLKYTKSTVGYVIKKWKVSGDCRNVPRVGRPTTGFFEGIINIKEQQMPLHPCWQSLLRHFPTAHERGLFHVRGSILRFSKPVFEILRTR
ncbi:transposable element Tc1 transposase [Caerostris extrusa]|uniref:Transposable element Tc1 transposase n=1 Tax=Caerostris extrusa TaxID=172846 RepID=A0AAV4NN39_CAEEX|nr:transposable element Tc1 transposase [Caerostris extrusa]